MMKWQNQGVSLRVWVIATCLCVVSSMTVQAQTAEPTQDPLVKALTDIERIDYDNRWLGYWIALAGCGAGLAMSGWALYEAPLANNGHPDTVILASSMVIAGAAASQIIHGAMRFDERVNSARAARDLLKDEKARAASGLFFLKYRAEEAKSTRLWGGIMTTAQGAGTAALGLRLWTKADGGEKTAGIVFTAMGLVNTAIGAVHFFGRPSSQRIYDRTRQAMGLGAEVALTPTILQTERLEHVPGLSLRGWF